MTKITPKVRNARRQSGCLRRPYKLLRKEESERQRRKGKIFPTEAEFQRTAKRER